MARLRDPRFPRRCGRPRRSPRQLTPPPADARPSAGGEILTLPARTSGAARAQETAYKWRLMALLVGRDGPNTLQRRRWLRTQLDGAAACPESFRRRQWIHSASRRPPEGPRMGTFRANRPTSGPADIGHWKRIIRCQQARRLRRPAPPRPRRGFRRRPRRGRAPRSASGACRRSTPRR